MVQCIHTYTLYSDNYYIKILLICIFVTPQANPSVLGGWPPFKIGIQWNPYNADTLWNEEIILIIGVSVFSGVPH